jgi:two-component system, cell cycle response regulator
MQNATILIIDDSETAAAHARRVLQECSSGYRILTAKDGLDGYKALVTTQVDLVLCDLVMQTMDGHKFLSLKRSRPELSDVPVIMLTGAGEVSEKVKALEGGAADYLTKPFHDAELVARVRVHLKIRSLQAELREKNARLEELSNTDPLTKLANRRHFLEVAGVELLRAQRYSTPLACVMVDLDHFKNINDGYGHLAGDAVLCAVADALRGGLRQHDMAARYGGEELVMLLPHTDVHGAEAVAQRYRRTIEELCISHDGVELCVTASLGIAAYPEHPASTLEDLLARADTGLYAAKAAGRNCVRVGEAPATQKPPATASPTE